MKNTIIITAIIIAIILSFGCNKDGKMVETTISGQLRTNGTQDVIKMSTELSAPTVDVYHVYWSGTTGAAGGGGNTYEIIATIPVTSDGEYSLSLDLNDNDNYYVGFSNIDESIYIQKNYSFYGSNDVNRYNHINIGGYNNINLYVNAKSWVRPRFINTNPDPNNDDVFNVIGGDVGPLSSDYFLVDISLIQQFYPIKGQVDTLAPWIHSTWGGEYSYNIQKPENAHKVVGKLTRNGVTTDVEIQYFVPPFDTSIVVIEY